MLRWSCLLFICFSLFACKPTTKKNHYYGYVEARLAYISSPVAGQLIHLNVQRGEPVKKGQLLYSLMPEPEHDAWQAARASLAAAKAKLKDLEKGEREPKLKALQAQIKQTAAQLTYANEMLVRNRKLFVHGNIQQQVYDQALENSEVAKWKIVELTANLQAAKLPGRIDQLEIAKQDIEKALANMHQAKWLFDQKKVKSIDTGHVFDTYYRVGEQVANRQPVLSILVPSQIKIIFFVPETALSNIHLNQAISIHCDGCMHTIAGHISFISPSAQYTPPVIYSREARSKLVYRVEARFAKTDKLHPGQPVDITL